METRSPSTTAAFTHAQVLSWVTPTLTNGIAFARSVSPTATVGQVLAASQPLGAGATVSLHELAEVPWTGDPQRSETELVKALLGIEVLTRAPPGPTFLDQLHADILRTEGALQALNHVVNG
jgi:Flp pilus assembly protein CpaB